MWHLLCFNASKPLLRVQGTAGRTIRRSRSERDVLCRCLAGQGHPGSGQVDFGAPTGVGTDLRVLVEIQLSRVHDLPARQSASTGTRRSAGAEMQLLAAFTPKLLKVPDEKQKPGD